MNYLSAENISKSFGDNWLFKNVTLGLSRGDKVALIGANGTGKTTLMTILAGITPSDEGNVSVRKDIRVGYLDQAPDFPDEFPVMEVLFQATTLRHKSSKNTNTHSILATTKNSWIRSNKWTRSKPGILKPK